MNATDASDKSATFAQSVLRGKSSELKHVFDLCVRKTGGNIRRRPDEPKAAPWALDGNHFAHKEGFYEIGNWTSSLFTGMALLAWRETEDDLFLNQVMMEALSRDYFRPEVGGRD